MDVSRVLEDFRKTASSEEVYRYLEHLVQEERCRSRKGEHGVEDENRSFISTRSGIPRGSSVIAESPRMNLPKTLSQLDLILEESFRTHSPDCSIVCSKIISKIDRKVPVTWGKVRSKISGRYHQIQRSSKQNLSGSNSSNAESAIKDETEEIYETLITNEESQLSSVSDSFGTMLTSYSHPADSSSASSKFVSTSIFGFNIQEREPSALQPITGKIPDSRISKAYLRKDKRKTVNGVCDFSRTISNPIYKNYNPKGYVKPEEELINELVEALVLKFNSWLHSVGQSSDTECDDHNRGNEGVTREKLLQIFKI